MMGDTSALSALTFALEKSARYHHRRRAFFEMVHRGIMFLVILVGSAAALDLLGDIKIVAVTVAVLGTFDLAYSPGTRGRDHLVLHQQFVTLLAQITRVGAPTDQQCRDWAAERLQIEANEPPIYWALEKDCHNEVCFARGKTSPEYLNSLRWYERAFMQILRFDVATPT